jgi:hypothetical protein
MSNCKRIGDLYLEVYDDGTDSETDKAFHDHMRHCPECREDFRWYGIAVESLTNLDGVAPPEDFLAQLSLRLDKVESSSSPHSSSIADFFRSIFSTAPSIPVPVGAAALVLIAAFGFLLYNDSFTEVMPSAGERVAQNPGTRASTAVSSAARPSGAMQAKSMIAQGGTIGALSPELPAPPTGLSRYSMMSPQTQSSVPASFPTVADRIGAGNLTVESPSIETAVESLKRLLPNIRGRLVEERAGRGMHELMLRVMIPPNSYSDLTSELINHGAVEAGAGTKANPPRLSPDGGKNVLLYIRFLPPGALSN